MIDAVVACVFWLFAGTVAMGISMGIDWEAMSWDAGPVGPTRIAHWSIAIGAIVLLAMGAVSLQ